MAKTSTFALYRVIDGIREYCNIESYEDSTNCYKALDNLWSRQSYIKALQVYLIIVDNVLHFHRVEVEVGMRWVPSKFTEKSQKCNAVNIEDFSLFKDRLIGCSIKEFLEAIQAIAPPNLLSHRLNLANKVDRFDLSV